MKRIVIGIFAHPDDETFGISPTVVHEVDNGAEVHLLSLTSGQNGTNPDNVADLGAVRREEWYAAGAIMGVKHMKLYDYIDGKLCNEDIDGIVAKLHAYVEPLTQDGVEIEFITFDLNGISGHIDHIVASHATSLLFYRLKAQHPAVITRLRYRCIPFSQAPEPNTGWRFMAAGCPDADIDETVDVPEHYDQVIAAIRVHVSQRNDAEMHISHQGRDICKNFYKVIS
jgi:LmbE family N-acetylglucosaminyl deacetylase